LYTKPKYNGRKFHLPVGKYSRTQLDVFGLGTSVIQSLKVNPGHTPELYDEKGYKGAVERITTKPGTSPNQRSHNPYLRKRGWKVPVGASLIVKPYFDAALLVSDPFLRNFNAVSESPLRVMPHPWRVDEFGRYVRIMYVKGKEQFVVHKWTGKTFVPVMMPSDTSTYLTSPYGNFSIGRNFIKARLGSSGQDHWQLNPQVDVVQGRPVLVQGNITNKVLHELIWQRSGRAVTLGEKDLGNQFKQLTFGASGVTPPNDHTGKQLPNDNLIDGFPKPGEIKGQGVFYINYATDKNGETKAEWANCHWTIPPLEYEKYMPVKLLRGELEKRAEKRSKTQQKTQQKTQHHKTLDCRVSTPHFASIMLRAKRSKKRSKTQHFFAAKHSKIQTHMHTHIMLRNAA